jgi:hypothetical protein
MKRHFYIKKRYWSLGALRLENIRWRSHSATRIGLYAYSCILHLCRHCMHLTGCPESIEWFIEDLVFSRSYKLAPPPPLPPGPFSPSVSSTIDTWILRKRDNLLTGGGRRTQSCEGEKVWSSINNSILSGLVNQSGHKSDRHPFCRLLSPWQQLGQQLLYINGLGSQVSSLTTGDSNLHR